MSRFLIMVGMVGGGYVGWWAGEYVGFGLLATFAVSTVGSAVGVYIGWKIGEEFLS
jgi:hypothetical protein